MHNSATNDAPKVTATGEAQVPVLTDHARLSVAVTVRDADQQVVLARRREAVAVVRTVLDRVTQLRQENERVNESVAHDRSHQASWSLDLAAEDEAGVDQLVEAVSRLSGVADCQVTGPAWQLSPATQHTVHLQALERATADARAQADAMVAGLGGRVTGVASVSSSSFVPVFVGSAPEAGRVVLAAGQEPLPERSLEIAGNPATEIVTASVEVEFTAEFPG